MADEPQLNSLDRFRKRPNKLVLEEHGHCEVPAGCGGVVFRWRSPDAGVPVTVHVYTPFEADIHLDGKTERSPTGLLALGPHVLGVSMTAVDLPEGLIMFAATHSPKEWQKVLPGGVVEVEMNVVSTDDGTWKYFFGQPGTTWATLSFDDTRWDRLVRVAAPASTSNQPNSYQVQACAARGAVCLGLPRPRRATSGRIWIRKVFEVPVPRWLDEE
jgi:hypothetical protein